MKNLFTKTLFISLLSSAVIPSGIQASSLMEKFRTAIVLEALKGVFIGEVVATVVDMLEGKEMSDVDFQMVTGGAAIGALAVAGIRAGIGVVVGSVGGILAGTAVEELAGVVPEERMGLIVSLLGGAGIVMGAIIGAVEEKKATKEVIFALT